MLAINVKSIPSVFETLSGCVKEDGCDDKFSQHTNALTKNV